MKKSFKKGAKLFYKEYPLVKRTDGALVMALKYIFGVTTSAQVKNYMVGITEMTPMQADAVADVFRQFGIDDPFD